MVLSLVFWCDVGGSVVFVVGGFGGWSTEGCYRDSDESTEQFTVCKCRHLTNFAIMMVSLWACKVT